MTDPSPVGVLLKEIFPVVEHKKDVLNQPVEACAVTLRRIFRNIYLKELLER